MHALLCSKTDSLLSYGQAPRDLVTYALKWLKLVAEEFKDEVNEGLIKKPRGGIECTITVLGPVKDVMNAHWLTVNIKETQSEDEPDPTAMHMLFLSADQTVLFYISSYSPDHRGDKFRAIAMDAEALREKRLVQPPRMLPRGKTRFAELTSANTALQRVHSLCSIGKLDPGLAAAAGLMTAPTAALDAPSPWRPLEESDALVQAQLRRLNTSQRAAICGLDGAVTLVQGPPGTGKSTFITAACLARVPKGSRILACTATNKAIDSLVAKLESAGLTQMLCVGSRRAMGEASCRFLMSSVLARNPALAEAEEEFELHAANLRQAEAELRNIPKSAVSDGDAGGKAGGGKRGGGRSARGGRGREDPGSTADSAAGSADSAAGGEGDEAPAALSAEEVAVAAKAAAEAKAKAAESKKLEAMRAEVKARVKKEAGLTQKSAEKVAELKGSARRDIWQSVQLVACTASSALQA